MPTIRINELTDKPSLLATDLIAVADANGVTYKGSLQQLEALLSGGAVSGYVGVVLASDASVTDDGFYIAGDSGTYTNNGGFVIDLSSKFILISKKGAVFTKVEIPLDLNALDLKLDKAAILNPFNELDDTKVSTDKKVYDGIKATADAVPTLDSNELVESGGVFSKIDLDKSNHLSVTYKSGTITTNVLIGSAVSLSVLANTSAKHGVIDCVEGDQFYLRGSGGNSPRLWAFLDVDNKLISISDANKNTYLVPETITAPALTAKAVFNTFTNVHLDSFILKLKSVFFDIDKTTTDKISLETAARIAEDTLIKNKVESTSKLFLKEVPLIIIEDSYISITTKLLTSHNDYKFVEPILLSTLPDDLYVSIGNQGGSVSQIHWLSGSSITVSNFVSSQITGVNGTDTQLIKLSLIKPATATHVAFSSLATYDLILYQVFTGAEFSEVLKKTFDSVYKSSLIFNSLAENPFNDEAKFLQKRASSLVSFNNENPFFFNFGQSNTDRRVAYVDAPQWFKDLNGKIANYMIWNRDNKKFQSYESGVCTGSSTINDTRWGYDIIFVKAYLDANPTKKIYSFSRSIGGTPIYNIPNGAASWNPKTETITAGKIALCESVVTELIEMISYCSLNDIKLNAQFISISQGESDADLGNVGINAFLQNRKNLISFFRGLLMTPNLPVINLQLKESGANSRYVEINNHLATISTEDSNHFIIQGMQSFNVLADGYNAHWDGVAMTYVGGEIYSKYLALNPIY